MIVGSDRIATEAGEVTTTELLKSAGVTAGTATASKAVVLDANKAIDAVRTASLLIGASGSEVAVTATPGELNKLSGAPFLVTTSSTTPASGSCAAQFVLKDAAGTAVAVPVAGTFYLSSSSTGLTAVQPGTSIAVLTNGALASRGSTALRGPFYDYVTTAAGLLGMTVTAAAGTYYIAFVLPNGKLAMSSAIVVN